MVGSLSRKAILLLLGALAAAGITLLLALALFGSENLLLVALKDDGFYFLALARNIAAGRGATFDGLGPTNGFHPLWTILLVPIFWLKAASAYTPVRITLLLATLLHLAGGAAVYRAARLISDRTSAALAAFFFLANPLGLYLVVSGMESPVVCLLVALLAAESIRIRSGEARMTDPGTIARVGILCGLCVLSRTDTILFVGLILAGVLLPGNLPAGFVRRLRGTAAAAGIAAAVVSPWIVWNLVRFGSLVQVSARAHHLHSISSRAAGEAPGLGRYFEVGESLAGGVLGSVRLRTGLPLLAIAGLLAIAVAVVGWWLAALLRGPREREEFLKRLRLFDAPLLYAIGILSAAFFFLGHIRSWYVAGPITIGAILFALPAHYAFSVSPLPRRGRMASGLIFAGIVAAALPLGVIFAREMLANSRSTPGWKVAASWVGEHTTPGERVASFNSGTFGYLAQRTVVNLDCVVNNRAIESLEHRRLVAFLRENHIRYLIDDPGYVGQYFRAYGEPGWREAIVPVDSLGHRLRVYAVR